MNVKRLFFLGFALTIALTVNVDAGWLFLENPSGLLQFDLYYDQTTGNIQGEIWDVDDNIYGSVYGTYNWATRAFTLAWLFYYEFGKCSGAYQGIWYGNGTPVIFENDCGVHGNSTLYIRGTRGGKRDMMAVSENE